MLYELLTNELPETDAAAVLEQKKIPKELQEIVMKGLMREEKRYKINDLYNCHESNNENGRIGDFFITYKGNVVKVLFNSYVDKRKLTSLVTPYGEFFLSSTYIIGNTYKRVVRCIDKRWRFPEDEDIADDFQRRVFNNFNEARDEFAFFNDIIEIAKTALVGILIQNARKVKTKENRFLGHRVERFLYSAAANSYVTQACFRGTYLNAKKFATEHGFRILDVEHAHLIDKSSKPCVFDNIIVTSTDNIAVAMKKKVLPPYNVKESDIFFTTSGFPILIGNEQSHLPYICRKDLWSRTFDGKASKFYLHKSFGYAQKVQPGETLMELGDRDAGMLQKSNTFNVGLLKYEINSRVMFISTRDPEVVEKVEAEAKQPGCPLKLL